MKVSENIIKGVYGIGFEKPSNIQKKIIPAFL
jgi:superfamily II DNA/RNA helicase